MKKRYVLLIAFISAFVLSNIITIPVISAKGMFYNADGSFTLLSYLRWELFIFVTFMLFSCVIMSHKFASGRIQEILFVFSAITLISELFGYLIFTLIDCNFDFSVVDWFGAFDKIMASWLYFMILAVTFAALSLVYVLVINKNFIQVFSRTSIGASGKLKQVKDSNLENSRWMTEEEKKKIFKVYQYSKLNDVDKDGIPVFARLDSKGKEMEVAFNSPCHALVIGSTGSGKTTTFVSPMIQLLAATNAGSSMVITDPKGELYSMHSKYLYERGYDVKVVDLRDTYLSYHWNPLDSIWDAYTDYRTAHAKAFKRHDNAYVSGLELVGDKDDFNKVDEWYEFDGKAYTDYQRLIESVKIYRKKIYDEVYEDLNDLVSVLIPIENEKDPLWEKGARSITLAVILAMLEDSENEENGMTKEKFNFFNVTKILQNSNKDYEDLRLYFTGRSPLSKAYSLSKQVCDAAPTTRASYMSIVYDKLTLFNDAGICALTSSSDFSAESLADHKTALFFKIPDEKDTRHKLAVVFILNIYKTLIKVASATKELSLPRNVYFIMDEFGNMPKIEKFDKFITVGRSRKIWFTMIVQSYSQLNNVYGETVADIIKGNCGIKMFIGSNDMNTCKEYSELCGNITIATTSQSGSANSETNFSTSVQTRPLIYPSELQRLNRPGDIGHSIIVTFGNYPLKTYFTPQFKVGLYHIGQMNSDLREKYFNESEVFYDVRIRNKAIQDANGNKGSQLKKNKPALQKETEATNEKADTTKSEDASNDIAQDDILRVFENAKLENPKLTFMEFCKKVAMGEIVINGEVIHNEK
ncbi:MAG: type IV secretory system conjugative DNA transfer family protein [Clostridia bacterium]|nr:type IV secretory system conjugative DNA transfer family protein [Clostridia bacterium]